jgi:IclR family pca regulon transcriptional regulator
MFDEQAVRSPEFVQSLERGLAVIRAFDADNPEQTLSDVARTTGLTRAAARRFLHTIVELGYMRSDGRLFALRPRVLELGYSYLSSLALPDIALPHMEKLVDTVHECASVSLLDGDEVVYVARVSTKRITAVQISVGMRFPAYATAMGRVLLADQNDDWIEGYLASAKLLPLTRNTTLDAAVLREELRTIRAQGWALVDQELEEGLRSIAVPIRGQKGQVVAAMNLSAHASRGNAMTIREDLLPSLRMTAALIQEDLRGVLQ